MRESISKHIADKGLISKIYKELIQLNCKIIIIIIQLKNRQRTWIDIFPTYIQMADSYMERCSTSLIIREMHIKTTMRYITSYLLWWLLSKRQEITNVGEDVKKREHLRSVSRNVNWYSHYRKQYGGSSRY